MKKADVGVGEDGNSFERRELNLKIKSKGIFNIFFSIPFFVASVAFLTQIPQVIKIGFNSDTFFWLLGIGLTMYIDYIFFMLIKIHNYSIELTDDGLSYFFIFRKEKLFIEIDKMYCITHMQKNGTMLNIYEIIFQDKSKMIFCTNNLTESEKDLVVQNIQTRSGKSFMSKKSNLIF